YFSASPRPALEAPLDQNGNAINLAGLIVLEFLKRKAQPPVGPQATTTRAVSETLFTEIYLSEQQSRWLVALNPVVTNGAPGATTFLTNPAGPGVVLND